MADAESVPFGSPDGAAQHPGSFVKFDDAGQWRDLALSGADRRARILVGRRGSGKSRYLRAMQLSVQNERLLDFSQTGGIVNISNLRWMHQAFPDRAERLEIWQAAWSCAIYAGVASFLLYSRRRDISDMLSQDDMDFLTGDARAFIPAGPRPLPIVMALNTLLENYADRSRLTSYLRDAAWNSIEHIVLDAIARETPLFCFIDILDDNYAHAPAESTDAQLGLLTWILSKVVDPNVSNRLHVVVTVRDIIYSALLETDNGQRYNDRMHIKCLDWDTRSSSYYLRQKIDQLPRQFCIGPPSGNAIKHWLGFDTILNSKRGNSEETVEDYILRHTRFLPREINEIGNGICTEIRRQKSQRNAIEPDTIRRIISNTAGRFAENMIKEVVFHMAALDEVTDDMPNARGYLNLMEAAVRKFLSSLKREKFTSTEIAAAEAAFKTENSWWSATVGGQAVTMQDVLWQHGLIGYRRAGDPGRWVRYFNSAAWGEGDTRSTLPEAAHYYLHSALLDIMTIQTEPSPPVAHAN